MAWAPSHYLNQCWLIISKVQCNSLRAIWKNITPTTNHWNYRENFLSKIFFNHPRPNGLTCSFIPESKLFSGKFRGQPQASRNYFEPTFWMIHQTKYGCRRATNDFVFVLIGVPGDLWPSAQKIHSWPCIGVLCIKWKFWIFMPQHSHYAGSLVWKLVIKDKIWIYPCNLTYKTSFITVKILTHCGRDKMAAIFQATYSSAFLWMKSFEF